MVRRVIVISKLKVFSTEGVGKPSVNSAHEVGGNRPGFGSIAYNFIRPIQTRSRFASGAEHLKLAAYNNSPDRSTKSTRSPINGLSVLVSTRFQVLFHSPPGVLFTFPSRYCSSIGHQVVFRVGGWSPRFPTGFHVSCGTLDPS